MQSYSRRLYVSRFECVTRAFSLLAVCLFVFNQEMYLLQFLFNSCEFLFIYSLMTFLASMKKIESVIVGVWPACVTVRPVFC